MKKYDRDNLNFLMKCTEKDFDEWMDEASNDEVEYAMELIRQAKSELIIEEIELQDLTVKFEDDMDDAKQILKRIKKNVR